MHSTLINAFRDQRKALVLLDCVSAMDLKEKILLFNLKTPYYISRDAGR